ncbi:MAG: DUF2306 domain-containing protein [Actinomycetota bacterium]
MRRAKPEWIVPTALILLCLIPVAAGAMRLTELTSGAAITPQNARFFASPIPVVIHIVGVTVFTLFGALQFVPSLRRGRPSWHRVAGRILIPAGILAALSGLWMSVFYRLPATDGVVLLVLRLIFGSAMVASLLLAARAIRRRDFTQHGAWMTRGYAIGLGAGSQAVILLSWMLILGQPNVTTRSVLMGAGWVVNLAVAEYVIRRRSVRSTQNPEASHRSLSASAPIS